jgi:predicted nuclease of predicted toxin-antitoxin system
MKLVVDMNLSTDWIPALRTVGIEAVHWAAIGPHDARDEAIMAWAYENEAIVLTRDLDFAAMLTMQGHALPSVIQLRIDQVRTERHLALVQRALSLYQSHLEKGAILTLEEKRMRVRVLNRDAEF